MDAQQATPVTCSTCNAQFSAPIQSIINGQDLSMKTAFLQGQINVYQCPQCSSIIRPDIPVLYYDLEISPRLSFDFLKV